MLDEFDEKAKEFLDKGENHRIRDILREYAMSAAYDMDKNLTILPDSLELQGLT